MLQTLRSINIRYFIGLFSLFVLISSKSVLAVSGPVFSSSSLSALDTVKGLFPPTVFCFIDEEPPKYSLMPISLREKIRAWMHASEHACGSAQGASITSSLSSSATKIQDLPVIQWIEEKISALWDATFNWVWEKIKQKAVHKLGW